jgi:hypothetical protein
MNVSPRRLRPYYAAIKNAAAYQIGLGETEIARFRYKSSTNSVHAPVHPHRAEGGFQHLDRNGLVNVPACGGQATLLATCTFGCSHL